MGTDYILTYNDFNSENIDIVGAKASRLVQLKKAGFTVPDFFILSFSCFQKFYKSNRYKNKIPKELSLESHLKFLDFDKDSSSKMLAVRSSALNEDGSVLTLAGQFDTILGINNISGLWQGIHKVWHSVENKNARWYLKHFSFRQKKSKMAVIVQDMLQADYAGVIFTKHPVLSDQNEIFVEITQGVGDKLVSGQIEPFRFTINRDTEKIDNDSNIDPDILNYFSKNGLFHDLYKIAMDIEHFFEEAQDIEWAVKDQQLFILQSRPIHSIKKKNTIVKDKKGKIWTDYFFIERFVEGLSPLGWSVLEKSTVKNAFKEPLWYLGFEKVFKSGKITKLYNGMPYTDINVFQKLYSPVPLSFISADKIHSLQLLNNRKSFLSAFFPCLYFVTVRMLFKDWQWFPEINLREWYRFVSSSNKLINKYRSEISHDKSVSKNVEIISKCEQLNDRFLAVHRWSITFADIFYVLLHSVLKRIFPQKESLKALNALLTGLDNYTIQANKHLLKLAAHLGTEQFDGEQEKFLQIHGHRSESLDIAKSSWYDNPKMIKKYLKHIDLETMSCFLNRFDEKYKERREYEKKALVEIKQLNILQRLYLTPLYHIVLRYSQQFTLLRENQRNQWHKILFIIRQAVLNIGQELLKEGVISNVDDLFFLTQKELFQLCMDKKIDFIRIEKRKLVTKNIDQNEKTFNSQQTIVGVGVSHGKSLGFVRIVRNLSEASEVQPGEILVAPSADPSWSPLFAVISGLILEKGGVLSHASVVAREFGLPAITSVENATHVLKNGDYISIDGDKGTIELKDKAA